MNINHVAHIAINTVDINESVAFYRDVLGFTPCQTADMGEVTLVYLKVNDSAYIELFDLCGNASTRAVAEENAGLRHIAFDVDDLAAWNDMLKAKNVPFLMDVTEMPQIGKRALLISDPCGVVVELCEDIYTNSI